MVHISVKYKQKKENKNMLAVQVSPRRKVWVSVEEDTFPNKGGYFCKVFDDPNGESLVDSFTISKNEIPMSITDGNERRKKAMVIANQRVKYML